MSNKHRFQPVRSGAAAGQAVRPVSLPANPKPVEATPPVAAEEPREAPMPEPVPDPVPPLETFRPAWADRIEKVKAGLDERFTIVADTWLAKRTRKPEMSARELQRLGYNVQQFLKLGLIAKV